VRGTKTVESCSIIAFSKFVEKNEARTKRLRFLQERDRSLIKPVGLVNLAPFCFDVTAADCASDTKPGVSREANFELGAL
jgi:hypothetical protein